MNPTSKYTNQKQTILWSQKHQRLLSNYKDLDLWVCWENSKKFHFWRNITKKIGGNYVNNLLESYDCNIYDNSFETTKGLEKNHDNPKEKRTDANPANVCTNCLKTSVITCLCMRCLRIKQEIPFLEWCENCGLVSALDNRTNRESEVIQLQKVRCL